MSKPIQMGVIARGYEGWRQASFNDPLPPLQDREMRRAFFSGARFLLSEIMEIMDPEDEPTERDLAQMVAIEAEFSAFYMAVQEGDA